MTLASFTRCQLQSRDYHNKSDGNIIPSSAAKDEGCRTRTSNTATAAQLIQKWSFAGPDTSARKLDDCSISSEWHQKTLEILRRDNVDKTNAIEEILKGNSENELFVINSSSLTKTVSRKPLDQFLNHKNLNPFDEDRAGSMSFKDKKKAFLISKISSAAEQIRLMRLEYCHSDQKSAIVKEELDRLQTHLTSLKETKNNLYQQLAKRREDHAIGCQKLNDQIVVFTDRCMLGTQKAIESKQKQIIEYNRISSENHWLQLEIQVFKQKCDEWREKHAKEWSRISTDAAANLQKDIRNMKIQMQIQYKRTLSKKQVEYRRKLKGAKENYNMRMKYANQRIQDRHTALEREYCPLGDTFATQISQLKTERGQYELNISSADNAIVQLRITNCEKMHQFASLQNCIKALQIRKLQEDERWKSLILTTTTEENILDNAITKEKEVQVVFKEALRQVTEDIKELNSQWKEVIQHIKNAAEIMEQRIQSSCNESVTFPTDSTIESAIAKCYENSIHLETEKWKNWQIHQYGLQQFRILNQQSTNNIKSFVVGDSQ